ncbi:EF-hand calcium-binding domain-containing protein 9-like [Centroberyx gerrardi]|uniref:EF-hand calcium-binding domain-containing protein 9-like n=1 Tax=Centroberyx gerrardi TaxID=166262 RepID=UPI003AABADDE
MKLKKTSIFCYLDFDSYHCLFSLQNAGILAAYFKLLDIHNKNTLNDVQFYSFMRHVTDLKKREIRLTFDIEFHVEKNFIRHHSSAVFELLDVDGDGMIDSEEFKSLGFLFNLKGHSLSKIFHEFDVSRDKNLNCKEFEVFTMACIYMQEETKKK